MRKYVTAIVMIVLLIFALQSQVIAEQAKSESNSGCNNCNNNSETLQEKEEESLRNP